MPILSRLRDRRSVEAACARALFAGRGLPPGAPARQQVLARLLEAAAGPATEQELSGEVAAAAAFVQVTSQPRPRRAARRALSAAACAVAVGGAVGYATVMPSPHHKMVPVQFGVPGAHRAVPAATRAPLRLPRSPQGRPEAQAVHRTARPAVPRSSGGR